MEDRPSTEFTLSEPDDPEQEDLDSGIPESQQNLEGGVETKIAPEQLVTNSVDIEGSTEVNARQQDVLKAEEKLVSAERELEEARANLNQAISGVVSSADAKEERVEQFREELAEIQANAETAEEEADDDDNTEEV